MSLMKAGGSIHMKKSMRLGLKFDRLDNENRKKIEDLIGSFKGRKEA
jgi:hypothetical protein